MVPTLYQLCLNTLISQSANIVDLHGVSFDPYLLDLLKIVFKPVNLPLGLRPSKKMTCGSTTISLQNLLARIGDAHGSKLQQTDYLHFGSLHLGAHSFTQAPQRLETLSQQGAPQFITRLDLSMTCLKDEDMACLKYMVNLVVLDLTNTLVTDYGVSHIHRFTQLVNTKKEEQEQSPGLRFLKVLSLAYNKNITDGCLKYIMDMPTLCGIDLSTTNVNKPVAMVCLKKHGFICNGKYDHHPPIGHQLSDTTTRRPNDPLLLRQGLCDASDKMEKDQYIPSRKILCPPHSLTLITYSDDPQATNHKARRIMDDATHLACQFKKTDNLGCLLLGTNTYESMILYCENHAASWRTWWWKERSQQTPLVFTRSTPPTTPSVGHKRRSSFDNTVRSSSSRLKRTSTLKGPLKVKHSQDAMSLLNNFQW